MIISDQQQKIVSASADERLIVKAGPGTGKTYSLIERIKYLIRNEELEPATEMLVLSFSVAAAREIRLRLQSAVAEQGYDDELLFVTIRTFDSFASYFMHSLKPDIDLGGLDYDQRIIRATEIVKTDRKAQDRLKRFRHIMVDEVQDLVGLRADFTLAVIAAADGGFTLFGDPAQAVYNFLMGEEVTGPTSDEFLQKVEILPGRNHTPFFLSENYRVEENQELKALADNGRRFLIEGSPGDAYDFLHRTFADLPSLGNLNDLTTPSDLQKKTTAFLCRTNGQVLLLAGILKKQKRPFSIRKPLEVKEIPAWVGAVFSGWTGQVVREREFREALDSIPDKLKGPGTAQEVWHDLQVVTRSRSGIRITQLRNALLEDGLFVQDMENQIADRFVLSTVHRAKGREFNNVVLLIPDFVDPEEYLDEGRVMFVGLTRARRKLFRMSDGGLKGLRKVSDRWLRTENFGGRPRLSAVEIGCSNDIDPHSPVSLEMFDDDTEEIEENQEFLRDAVLPGQPARLKFYRTSKGVPLYHVKVQDGSDWIAVAHTSWKFGRSLKNCLTELQCKRTLRLPGIIDGLWVSDIVTELGNLGNEDVPRHYRTTGLWLGIRIEGFGSCREWGEI